MCLIGTGVSLKIFMLNIHSSYLSTPDLSIESTHQKHRVRRWKLLAGMMSYEDGLRLLAGVESPRPPDMPERDYQLWVNDLVASKYTYIVASQVLPRSFIHLRASN